MEALDPPMTADRFGCPLRGARGRGDEVAGFLRDLAAPFGARRRLDQAVQGGEARLVRVAPVADQPVALGADGVGSGLDPTMVLAGDLQALEILRRGTDRNTHV